MVVDLWMLDKKEQEKVTLLTELANSDELILPVSELMEPWTGQSTRRSKMHDH
ncbi:hypothetical protein ACAW68_06550 [Weissella confusa]|uniref:hypothetical protein n=1 Tax=Weissella confusa TaxID=1583 RepID=UPI0035A2A7AD